MDVEAYLNGIFPRSDKSLEAGSNLLKGRETKENFFKLLEKETLEIIELQENFGLSYITDGQLFWHDFLRPIADSLGLHREDSSADENPVTRQIYTNTFYRRPLILNRIRSFSKNLIDGKSLAYIKKGKRKVILPSPFAFTYLSDGIHHNEKGIKKDVFIEVLFDIAEVLNNEARRLENSCDVSFIQFNEPCIPYAPETKLLWESIKESLRIATKNLKAITSLHLYNGDVSKFLPDLPELPVKRIGIDPYTTDIRKFIGTNLKFLEIGVINSKNSLIEEPETIVNYAKQILKKIEPSGLALVPNRPLELLPQKIAIKKVENLAKAAQKLNSK